MLGIERFGKVWVNFENFKLLTESFRKVISFYEMFTGKQVGFS
jgi:hypothetical protein